VFKAQFFGLIGDPDIDRIVVQDVEPPVFKVIIVRLLILYYFLFFLSWIMLNTMMHVCCWMICQ